MNGRALWGIGVGLGVLALLWVVLKKDRPPPAPDPAFYHTAEGVNFTIQAQKSVLEEALEKKDLPFIHGHMYYLQGMADALSGKLEGTKKQRVDPKLQELKKIAEELDNFSGRGNYEATKIGLGKLLGVFKELDAEFQTAPPPKR